MGRKENDRDERDRISDLRGALFDYRSDGDNCDREFADVLSEGLREAPGHDQPSK